MSKYSIHSTKQDWLDLYKEFEIMNFLYSFNMDIKRIKKSTSYDMCWSMLQIMKKEVGIAKPFQYGTTTTSWKNGKKTETFTPASIK
tara:strand:- start:237 stop:497 length:261 start_codon:yes stop_codon:yes gene_type:complete